MELMKEQLTMSTKEDRLKTRLKPSRVVSLRKKTIQRAMKMLIHQ